MSGSLPQHPSRWASQCKKVLWGKSASFLLNNLTGNEDRVLTVHDTEMCIFNLSRGREDPCPEKQAAPIHQAVLAPDGKRIIVAGQGYVAFLSGDGRQTLASHTLAPENSSTSNLGTKSLFARGLAIAKDTQQVAVGTSDGRILLFDGNHELQYQRSDHRAAISCATFASLPDGSILITGADDGQIMIWKPLSMILDTQLTRTTSPVTGLVVKKRYCISSHGDGKIRLFDLLDSVEYAVIHAHARWIMSLAAHPTEPWFVSASEDTRVCVWSLPSVTSPRVELLWHTELTDCLLTGVAFCGPNYSQLAVSTYDSTILRIFNYRPPSSTSSC